MAQESNLKTLASELLGMTYGDLMDMAEVLSAIMVNSATDISNADDLAATLHEWAKRQNEAD